LILFADFKYRVLQLRKGKYDFNPLKVEIKETSSYIGSQVANSACGWIIATMILGLILVPLSMPIFWQFIWERRGILLKVILGPAFIQMIVVLIVQKFAIGPNSILRRRLWGILEVFLFFVTIATGIVSALMRLIKMMAVALFGIMRMDQALVPEWFLRISNTDTAFKAYLATVLMYHLYNNPIGLTFARMLVHSTGKRYQDFSNQPSTDSKKAPEDVKKIELESKEEQPKLVEFIEIKKSKLTKKTLANKLRLWAFMAKYYHTNAKLHNFRKAHLAEEAEKKKKELEAQKQSKAKKPEKEANTVDKAEEPLKKKRGCIIF